jgi:hypothetical protein
MKVYPVAGGRVRDPRTRAIIPADGYEVGDNDFYWLRRIAHGDVTQKPPAEAAVEPAGVEPAAAAEGAETAPVPATIAEETHQ